MGSILRRGQRWLQWDASPGKAGKDSAQARRALSCCGKKKFAPPVPPMFFVSAVDKGLKRRFGVSAVDKALRAGFGASAVDEGLTRRGALTRGTKLLITQGESWEPGKLRDCKGGREETPMGNSGNCDVLPRPILGLERTGNGSTGVYGK